jgi:hypothetical protein
MVVALADMDLGFSERPVEIGLITQEFPYGLRMFAVRGARNVERPHKGHRRTRQTPKLVLEGSPLFWR